MHTGMLIAHCYATFLWALNYNNLVGQLTCIDDADGGSLDHNGHDHDKLMMMIDDDVWSGFTRRATQPPWWSRSTRSSAKTSTGLTTTFPERWKNYQQKYSKAKPLVGLTTTISKRGKKMCCTRKKRKYHLEFKIFFQIRVHSVIYTADNVLTPEVITNNWWILSMMTFGGFFIWWHGRFLMIFNGFSLTLEPKVMKAIYKQRVAMDQLQQKNIETGSTKTFQVILHQIFCSFVQSMYWRISLLCT